MKKAFGFTYLALTAATILFQLAALLGAPIAALTQGGVASGALSTTGKMTAGVSVVILLALGSVVAQKAEIWNFKPKSKYWNIGFWAVVVVNSIEFILNWITPSQLERLVWGPVNTVLFTCVVGIAILSRRK